MAFEGTNGARSRNEAPDKMEINGALAALAAGEPEGWVDRARAVIAAYAGMERQGALSAETVVITHKEGARMTGHADNMGNVTASVNETKERALKVGVAEARVGHFKVRKVKEGILEFNRFWRSGISTEPREEKRPQRFRLNYDPKTLEPLRVVTEKTEKVVGFGPLNVFATYDVPLLSIEPNAKARKAGYQITMGN